MYISNAWVSGSARKQKPTMMGWVLVMRGKWNEINLECLHGKWSVWLVRSGCWIWSYGGINHTNTCAWNTCGALVQNLPKMPICQIKVMEHPPPSPSPSPQNSTLTNPFSGTLWKKPGFLVKFGYAWILLDFLSGRWFNLSFCKSIPKNPQPFHFRYPTVNWTRLQSDSWNKTTPSPG